MQKAIYAGIAVLALVVVIGSTVVIRTLIDWGTFTHLRAHAPGACLAIASPPGPEDLALDRETGLVFVAAYDRRKGPGRGAPGGLHVLDLGADQPRMRNVTPDGLGLFRPHGIGLWREADRLYLHAVNHGDEEQVAIFEVEGTSIDTLRLVPVMSVGDGRFRSLNDVLPVGPDRFYVTNDSTADPGMGKRMELAMAKDSASVFHFDGADVRLAADGLSFANGIAMSPDGGTVYVAETMDRTLRIYDRDPATGALTQRELTEGLVWIGTGADNIDVDPDGALWIAAHPKVLAFASHRSDPRKTAPSQILKLTPNPDGPGGTVDEVLLDKGEALSGASVAVAHDGKLLMGAAFDPKILVCELPDSHGRLKDWLDHQGEGG
jgi:arylesterase/paraoxonase